MSPYTKQTWQDYSPNYPVSAARMGHIEDGIGTIDANLTAATASLASVTTDLATVSATVGATLPWVATTVDRQLSPYEVGVVAYASCTITLPPVAQVPPSGRRGVKSGGPGIIVQVVTPSVGVLQRAVIDPLGINQSSITIDGEYSMDFAPDPDGANWLIVGDSAATTGTAIAQVGPPVALTAPVLS